MSHLTNSLIVYLHLLQPLCQCLNLCDEGAEWWCVTHSSWKITAALRSSQRPMKNHWLLLVPNKRMWWKSQRLAERKRDSEGGAEECKTRPHPSHELRRDIPVPLARGYIHSKSQKRGNLGEAGRGTHQYTTSPLGSLCAQTQCLFQSNSIASISMTNVHFDADEYVHTCNNKKQEKTKSQHGHQWLKFLTLLPSPVLSPSNWS